MNQSVKAAKVKFKKKVMQLNSRKQSSELSQRIIMEWKYYCYYFFLNLLLLLLLLLLLSSLSLLLSCWSNEEM